MRRMCKVKTKLRISYIKILTGISGNNINNKTLTNNGLCDMGKFENTILLKYDEKRE